MNTLAPPLGPTWFPFPPLTSGMQDTKETLGRPQWLCLLASPSPPPSYQGETVLDRYSTRSPLQFCVRLFPMTLHETIGDSFLPKPILSYSRLDCVHSPRRQTLCLQYHGRWYFPRHKGSCYGFRCCGATRKQPRNNPGSCPQGKCPPSGNHGSVPRNRPRHGNL